MSPSSPDCGAALKNLFRMDEQHRPRPKIDDPPPLEYNHHRHAREHLLTPGSNFEDNSARITSHTIHGAEPESLPLTRNNVPGTDRMEECFRKIVATFSAGDNSRFDVVSCALSCNLVAARPLYTLELIDAITISLEAQDKAVPTRGMQTHDFLDWLRQHEHPFRIDENLLITFEDDAMPYFLQKVPIRGVDNTHRTLAMVCLRKIRQSEELGIMNYASRFWEHHCERAAENGCARSHDHQDYQTRVPCRRISHQERRRDSPYQKKHFGNLKQPASLHTDNDWVYVGQSRKAA